MRCVEEQVDVVKIARLIVAQPRLTGEVAKAKFLV